MKKFVKSGLVVSWGISYLLIVCILLVIMVSMYGVFAGQVEKHINYQNELIITNVCEEIDRELINIERTLEALSIDNRFASLTGMTPPLSSEDYYDLYNYLKGYNPTKAYHSSLTDRCLIYLSNIETIISSTGVNTAESAYNQGSTSKYMPLSEWSALLENEYDGKYINIGGSDGSIYYAKTVMLSEAESLPINGFYLISKNWIEKKIEKLHFSEYGQFVITDIDGRDVFEFGNNQALVEQREILRDKKIVCITHQSNTNNWAYKYYLPKAVVFKDFTMIKTMMILSVLLCIVIGVFLAIYFIRKNYKPVFELTNIFSNGRQLNAKDEYSYIKEMIQKSFKEKENLFYDIDSQNEVIAKYILRKLLNGDSLTELEGKRLESLNFNKEHRFVTIQIKSAQLDNIFFESDGGTAGNGSVSLANFIVDNIVSELLENNNAAFACILSESHEGIIYIVNTAMEISQLIGILENALRFIKNTFNFTFFCGIGGIHYDYCGIAQSFVETSQVMDYTIISNKHGIHCYDDIHKQTQYICGYPVETELKLIEYVKLGQKEEVSAMLGEIFANILNKEGITLDEIRFLMIDLSTTAIKILAQKGTGGSDLVNYKMHIMNDIIKNNDVDKMKSKVLDMFDAAYSNTAEDGSPSGRMIKRIINFVQLHYRDPNLNVSMVADHLLLHPHYISTIFKDEMNTRLLMYINTLRVEESKHHLIDTDESIRTISEKVGFNSYRSFVRVFSNIVGLAPTEYREAHTEALDVKRNWKQKESNGYEKV